MSGGGGAGRGGFAKSSGLCPGCAFVRRVESARGSVFLLCRKSTEDARFPKYPPQPVIGCVGYVSAAKGGGESTEREGTR